MVEIPTLNEPTFNGCGVISIKNAAKFLHISRAKVDLLIQCGYFGSMKARNGGRLLSVKSLVNLRDLVTAPEFPANAPLKHKNILIELFQPEEDIVCQILG